ncbi:MAG: pyrroline-5-carboxylate reductase [Acidovorax sp. SCN 68-22]|nr:MAG: pyrroline-5-carboxylate reductase [Acidovorax sp. SCN 68-22]
MSDSASPAPAATAPSIAFIGGGNMASAIIGGLVAEGLAPERIEVVEPAEAARAALQARWGIAAQALPGPQLRGADLVVWAVKPQVFREAALQVRPLTAEALHLSVAAGIRSSSIAQWLGTERVVRAMPNTPALIGRGISALFARTAVGAQERQRIEQLLAPTGETLWVEREQDLDAVTALSGSGPAYVFYLLEAMTEAGVHLGLGPAQAHRLALATVAGAAELARRSDEPPQVLRQRVTSKGGTTHAAIEVLERAGVVGHFGHAIAAAGERARELGDEFGTSH